MQCVTGSQCRVSRIGWMLSDFLALHTNLAAAFWTFWSLSSKYWGQPGSKELQKSKRERTREHTRVAWVVRRCRMELVFLICMYAALHVLLMCWGMLRVESRVTPRFFTDDTNGTSASPMWMADGKGLWTDILVWSWLQFCCHLLEVCLRSSKTWHL